MDTIKKQILVAKLEAIERKIKLQYFIDAENMIDSLLYELGRVREDKQKD